MATKQMTAQTSSIAEGWQRLMHSASFTEPHQSVELAFEILKSHGHSELNCEDFVQYFLKEDTTSPWTPYLFGGLSPPEHRFIMTGSVAEGTSIAHLAKQLGSISEADMMLIFGRCGKEAPLEMKNSGHPGYYLLRVRSTRAVSKAFLETLCEKYANDFYLSPQKTITYLKTVARRVFRECKVKKYIRNRPATTLSFAELSNDEDQTFQNVMIDITPAIETDMPVGQIDNIDSIPWLTREKKWFIERLPRLLVPKGRTKEDTLQWRVSTSVAERWLFSNSRSQKILRIMKIIKACYFPWCREEENDIDQKSFKAYHLKTALLEYFTHVSPEEMSADWNVSQLASDVIDIYSMFFKVHLKKCNQSNFFIKEVNLMEGIDPESNYFRQVVRVLKNRKSLAKKVKRAVVGLIDKSFCDANDVHFQELPKRQCTFQADVARQCNRQTSEISKPLSAYPFYQNAGRLFESARSGDLQRLQSLLPINRDDINCRAPSGETPLYVASYFGHADIVKQLIASGADVMSRTQTLSTPLLAAVRQKHPKVVRLILNKLGENQPVGNGQLMNDGVDVTDILGQTPLIVAAMGGDIDMINLLLDHGASVNYANEDGNTALHVAVLHGNQEAVDFLLGKGADLEYQNVDGSSPLMVASGHGQTAIVERLLAGGVDVNATSKVDGETALHWAARNGSTSIVSVLLEHRADPDIVSLYHRTALLEAVSGGHTAVVKLLLTNGAEAKTTDFEQTPALFYAVQLEYKDVVELLLGRGADPNWCHPLTGLTLVHRMCAAGRTDILRLLIRHGADIRPKTRDGRTALQVAVKNQRQETISFLHQYYADNPYLVVKRRQYCEFVLYCFVPVFLLLLVFQPFM